MIRRLETSMSLIGFAVFSMLLVGGCGQRVEVSGVVPSALVTMPEAAGVTSLPDDVPLPPGALIVAGPDRIATENEGSTVSGWSAVATQSVAAVPAQTADWLRQQLLAAGWSSSREGTSGSAASNDREDWFVSEAGAGGSSPEVATPGEVDIGVQRQLASEGEQLTQWLRITVTSPLAGSGPAVAYRFASAQVDPVPPLPSASASASASPGSRGRSTARPSKPALDPSSSASSPRSSSVSPGARRA